MKCRVWMVCAVAALTLCMNAPTLGRLARSGFRLATSWRSSYRGTSETVDAVRRMAALAKANGKSIAYCRSRGDGLLPIERSRVLAMSWETAPYPACNGLLPEIIGADAIVAAEFEPIIDSELRDHGYSIRESGGGVNLWCRGGDWKDHPVQQGGSGSISEIFSLSALVALLTCCFFVCRCEGVVIGLSSLSVVMFVVGGMMGFVSLCSSLSVAAIVVVCLLLWKRHVTCCGGGFDPTAFTFTRRQVTVAGILAIIYASLALSHTFAAPNGLGTVGGRAKMMFLAGGINDGFYADLAFAPFQPAYPPGAASLLLWCDALSGSCGEWILQLLPCMLMAAMAGCLVSRLRSALGAVFVLVVFTTPVSLRLATLFYPEVYVAICCLIGWERIRENRLDYIGWLLIGAAGWFKNEGLVYFCSVAMAVVVVSPHIGFRQLALRVALGAALPTVWHLGCRLAGASLDGYLPVDQLRMHQFVAAAYRALQYMFCSAWQYAFLFPLAFVFALVPRWRTSNMTTVVIGVLFSVAGFASILSLSAALDFEWHLDSMERLLWVPSLFILRECECILGYGEPTSSAALPDRWRRPTLPVLQAQLKCAILPTKHKNVLVGLGTREGLTPVNMSR